jgi:hypothetical protein
MPLRFTILQFAQRFLTDADTFMITLSFHAEAGYSNPSRLQAGNTAKVTIILVFYLSV